MSGYLFHIEIRQYVYIGRENSLLLRRELQYNLEIISSCLDDPSSHDVMGQ